jgi:predicted metalloprotease
MKWRRGTRSDNLRDQRSATGGRGGLGGISLPGGIRGGIGGLVILLILAVLGGNQLLDSSSTGSVDLDDVLDGFQDSGSPAAGASDQVPGAPDPDQELVDFLSFVLDDIQATWAEILPESGHQYRDADLVVFRDAVDTGCGNATAAVGPFYCPPDETAFLDLGFFRELNQRFDAPGDFAQAYVIAHELGHHVQNLLGIDDEVRRQQNQDPDGANELSVRMELQADCFAGVWGHSVYNRGLLEDGDLQEGLDAAAAVGDDRIQSQAGVDVNPETWTHGSAEQRQEWFNRGFDSGDPAACDTFSPASL